MVKLRLATVLKERKISKYRFAQLLDERYSSIFRYFRPGYETQVKLKTLDKWAKAIKCKISDLYAENNNSTNNNKANNKNGNNKKLG